MSAMFTPMRADDFDEDQRPWWVLDESGWVWIISFSVPTSATENSLLSVKQQISWMDRNLIEVLMMDIKDPISDVQNRVLELTDFRKISFTPQKQLFYQIMK